MLADEVIALPLTPNKIDRVMPDQRVGYQALALDVAQAHRFVLRRDAVFLIHTISNIAMSRITPALQICRMPFPKMWVEFVYRDRDDWYNEADVKRNFIDNASSPSRLGFLLEQKDTEGRIVECTVVWKHLNDPNMHDDAIVIGGFAMTIDTSPGVGVSDEVRLNFTRARLNPTALEQKFHMVERYADPADEEAALELESRIKIDFCAYMLPFWVYTQQNYPNEMERVRENAMFDLLQEWRFVIGLLTVLNSRNVISYSDPITFEKLNKQRKQKGKPLLHDHREIRLSLSRIQRNRIGSGNPIDLQAHSVRGHWKLRSTGLFWWSPFIRGSGPVRAKPYHVKV